MKTTVLLMTMVSAWAFGPFPALAQNKSTCYMFQGSADRKNEKAYYSPIRTYQSPGKCPKGTEYSRQRARTWVPFVTEKYGIDPREISNRSSRTFCECIREDPHHSISAEKAESFAQGTRSDFLHKYRNFKLIEEADFYPE